MKKLLFLLAFLLVFSFSSCNADDNSSAPPNEPGTDGILVPSLSDVGRKNVIFDDIVYSRPDTGTLIAKVNALAEEVKSDALSYGELTEKIEEIDAEYCFFDSMSSYMMIKSSASLSDTDANTEYELLKSRAPAVSRAIDDLLVTLALSPFAERLEDEVFGEGFVEEYSKGSKFNDYVVALLEDEAKLEAEYFAMSGSNIKIIFDGVTDTYDRTVARITEEYRDDSAKLQRALEVCETLLQNEMRRQSELIFIELLKTRSKLAEAYGSQSYTEYAYESLGHDYSPEAMDALLDDISEYAVPVYFSLTQKAFAGYFKTHKPSSVSTEQIINGTYTALSHVDSEIAAVYSYMINCGLYDIELYNSDRRDGAFTVYLADSEVPFVFASLYGDAGDYMTVAHEFGHFYDNFINFGSNVSLDLCEISSQALEMLTLTKFKEILSTEDYKYLYYKQMSSLLQTLIIQGFYAKFEALAYALPYSEITKERLDELVVTAAAEMRLNTDYFNELSDAVIIHLIDTPFYVQSYCTSLISAFDIFFIECEESGKGATVYKALIDRESDDGFESNLERAGIGSPFRRDAVISIADDIYFSIIGSHYYITNPDSENAA